MTTTQTKEPSVDALMELVEGYVRESVTRANQSRSASYAYSHLADPEPCRMPVRAAAQRLAATPQGQDPWKRAEQRLADAGHVAQGQAQALTDKETPK